MFTKFFWVSSLGEVPAKFKRARIETSFVAMLLSLAIQIFFTALLAIEHNVIEHLQCQFVLLTRNEFLSAHWTFVGVFLIFVTATHANYFFTFIALGNFVNYKEANRTNKAFEQFLILLHYILF